jgi:dCMP deaminase
LCCGVSLKFIEQIINMYKYLGFDVTLTKSNREKPLYPIYTLSRPGRRGLFILKELYSHKGLFMPRKYEKFIEATRLTTDEIMMETAHTVSLRSTCLRAKVGCVITDENKNNILSMGYNGGVRGQENFCESSFPGECGCIHAECNALLKNKGPILYCTTMPCKSCSKMIVNAGVKAVYYGSEYRQSYAKSIFAKAKIPCKRISRENYSWKLDVVPK